MKPWRISKHFCWVLAIGWHWKSSSGCNHGCACLVWTIRPILRPPPIEKIKQKFHLVIWKLRLEPHLRANRFDVFRVVIQLCIDVTPHGSFCAYINQLGNQKQLYHDNNTHRRWYRACSEPRKGTDWFYPHCWLTCPGEPLSVSWPARRFVCWKCRWNPQGSWSETSVSTSYACRAIWCQCSWANPYSAMGGGTDTRGIYRSICYCLVKPFT